MDEATMKQILGQVRNLVQAGQGEKALSALLHAVRLSHPDGERGVFSFLDMAKEMMSIQRRQDEYDEINEALIVVEKLMNADSLLHDMGDTDILRDAYEDGSSVICRKCSALVKKCRWKQHSLRWCPALGDVGSDDDDDED